MKAEERQKKIKEYLQEAEFASLEELARHVLTSVSTVRRDVTDLESEGIVRRTHGGARLINVQSDEFVFSWRNTLQLSEKEAIGKVCAGLVQPGQSLIIDSGTTVYHAARHLEPQVLHVITNSLPVANLFASSQQIEVMVSGGVIYPRLGVLVGPLAVDAFSKLHADVAIMGIQRAMINAAGKVIFCLDHTKFGRRSVAHLCDLSCIDVVVTDAGAPVELVNALRAKGLEVVVTARAEGDTTESPTPAPIVRSRTEATKNHPAAAPSRQAAASPSPVPETTESSDSRMGWD